MKHQNDIARLEAYTGQDIGFQPIKGNMVQLTRK